MEYEYLDVHLLFNKMVINTKELFCTMKRVDDLLHDPEFEEKLKTFSKQQLEELHRLFTLYNQYALELKEMM